MTVFRIGIESLAQQNFAPLHGKRVGLMTNPSAVDSQLRMSYDILWNAPQVQLTALFAPEHGFLGSVADGEKVDSQIDPRTNLPVFSLYGDSLRPSPQMLESIDVMVCDIQDVGVRYYTFLWTISHIIEACGEHGVPVMILDRPNPLGHKFNGSPLEPEFSSLVGRYDVPVQHGMTIGEMLTMLNETVNPTPADLHVIPCENYRHDMTWEDTGLAFISPSPNMPHLVTARHYPGACLIEGTTLSEGRGTSLPFEIVGAPFINAMELADTLNKLNLPSVRFRAHFFTPTASKFAGMECHGVQVHILDGTLYDPISTWLHVIHVIRQRYPAEFQWLEPYHPGGMRHFDRLIGNARVRQQLDEGVAIEAIIREWDDYLQEFEKKRRSYLLYE